MKDNLLRDGAVWHYTTGQKAACILACGELRPSDSFIEIGEKPVLWFSAHPQWEPTANKLLGDKSGNARPLTMEETAHYGNGLVRFGLPPSRLVRWPELAHLAKMASKIQRALEKIGRRQGANPGNWWGTLDPVPVDNCIVQVMGADGAWNTATRGPMAREQLELPGILTGESLVRWLERPDLIERAAAARIGLIFAEHLRGRRKVTVSFALDMARVFGNARFAHDCRRTLAAAASLGIQGLKIPAGKLPDEKEVAARMETMAKEACRELEKLLRAMREIGRVNDVR